MNKEQRKQRAVACFERLRTMGRTCSGCGDQYLCGILEYNAQWLFGEFLPAIDPTGQVFGFPKTTRATDA